MGIKQWIIFLVLFLPLFSGCASSCSREKSELERDIETAKQEMEKLLVGFAASPSITCPPDTVLDTSFPDNGKPIVIVTPEGIHLDNTDFYESLLLESWCSVSWRAVKERDPKSRQELISNCLDIKEDFETSSFHEFDIEAHYTSFSTALRNQFPIFQKNVITLKDWKVVPPSAEELAPLQPFSDRKLEPIVEGYFLPKLYVYLRSLATMQKEKSRIDKKHWFLGELSYLVHKDAPVDLITSVLYTAGQAEYGNYTALLSRDGEEQHCYKQTKDEDLLEILKMMKEANKQQPIGQP